MSEVNQTQKLLAEKKKIETTGSMTALNAIAIDCGIPARKHYPTLKNAEGKTIKDDRGYSKKSDKSDGYTLTLAIFGKMQFVHLVMSKPVTLQPGVAYRVSGIGYDMRDHFYVKREGKISNY